MCFSCLLFFDMFKVLYLNCTSVYLAKIAILQPVLAIDSTIYIWVWRDECETVRTDILSRHWLLCVINLYWSQWSNRNSKYLNLLSAESKIFLSSSMKINVLYFAKLYEAVDLQQRTELRLCRMNILIIFCQLRSYLLHTVA